MFVFIFVVGWLFSMAIWVSLGMKSDKIYAVVEFFSRHSKIVSPMVYDLVLRGRTNKGIRIIALIASGALVNIPIPLVVAVMIAGG